MNAYEIRLPSPSGWYSGTVVAGRNEAEAAAIAADHVGQGNAFRLRPFHYSDPHAFPHPRLPLDYNARACATARMVNPAYLTTTQLLLVIEADEAERGGQPF